MSGDRVPGQSFSYGSRTVVSTNGVISDPHGVDYQNREIKNLQESQENLRKAPARIAACCLVAAAGCILCGGATMFLINNPQIVDQTLKIFNP